MANFPSAGGNGSSASGNESTLDRVVARLSSDFSSVSANEAYQVIPFDVGSYNPNDSFVSASNHYEVPVSGDYHTDLVISYQNNGASSDDRINVVIRKNDSEDILSLRHDISDQISSAGAMPITLSGVLPQLLVGDILTAEMYDADDVIISVAEFSSWSISQMPTSTVVSSGSVPVNDLSYIEWAVNASPSGTKCLFDTVLEGGSGFDTSTEGDLGILSGGRYEIQVNAGLNTVDQDIHININGVAKRTFADGSISGREKPLILELSAGDVISVTTDTAAVFYGGAGSAATDKDYSRIVVNQLAVKSIVNQELQELTVDRLLDSNSLAADQLPSGLGVANQAQIEFGAAQSGDGWAMDALGTVNISEAGYYKIKVGLLFGRTGSGGVSELWFYLTVNGVQAGKSIVYDFDGANDSHYLDYETLTYIPAGAEIKGYVLRDSNADNSGGLYRRLSNDGLNPAPCASLRLDRLSLT